MLFLLTVNESLKLLLKGCLLNNSLVVNCLILAFIGFSKNGSSDNLAFVNSLILGFIVFP